MSEIKNQRNTRLTVSEVAQHFFCMWREDRPVDGLVFVIIEVHIVYYFLLSMWARWESLWTLWSPGEMALFLRTILSPNKVEQG